MSVSTPSVKALTGLNKRMETARQLRVTLKRLLAESDYLLESHHSAFALENVTMDREIDRMSDEIIDKTRTVTRLQRNAETAEAEHTRLVLQNSELLDIVRSKEKTLTEIKSRIGAVVAAERRAGKAVLDVSTSTSRLSDKRAAHANQRQALLGTIGTNHAENLSLEQNVLELKLELDAYRSACQLPVRKHDIPVSFAVFLSPCEHAECVRARKSWLQMDVTSRPPINATASKPPPLQPL
jgi:hypothetical protein